MAKNMPCVLGLEGGGTKTTWILVAPDGRVRAQGVAGPGNTLLLRDAALGQLFRGIARATGGNISSIGGAFAGCQMADEQKRVERALRRVWPRAATVRIMEDTRSVLAAVFGNGPGIMVIAGTGSNVAGQKSLSTPTEKAGGWGHLFADRGSAYDLARRGLENVFARYDAEKKISSLAREYLKVAGQSILEELVPFMLRDTSKTAVAAYAKCVFSAAQKGDRDARALLDEAIDALTGKVAAVARRMRIPRVPVTLTGGLFENQPDYLARFQRALRKKLPGSKSFLCTVPGALGAARVAGAAIGETAGRSSPHHLNLINPIQPSSAKPIAEPARLAAFSAASTEQRNPRSRGLDRRTIPQLVDLFIREERRVESALFAQRRPISRAAELVARKLRAGGRLIYVGAGTSGRLGVLDASEMPPTFNAPPEQVQAVIAGGPEAVFKGLEGAEDVRETSVAELRARRLSKKDVVCGIAASGQTPFVLAALEEGRRKGAGTILLSCNPRRAIRVPVDVEIDLATGPELVTGSTRLKAGTATKLVINMLSTIAMVRLGRVTDNLMTNVQASNDKLRARAVRLVQALSTCSAAEAQRALEKKAWRVPATLEFLRASRKNARSSQNH
jgi:N-acetylmuramic acid 6-phosphate etherase